MATRPPVALAVGALVCAALAGCGGGSDAVTPTATPTQYIAAVEQLMDPPAQLASSVSERAGDSTVPRPSRKRLDRIVTSARERLADFRAIRLGDPVLRRQRARLAGAYARLIPSMDGVVDALVDEDSTGLATAARPFLDALDSLPSAAASSR